MSFSLERPAGRTVHRLKTEAKYFNDTLNGLKDFEVRRNDRSFAAGDTVELVEQTEDGGEGRTLRRRIKYILSDARFCREGYIVLGLED